MAGNLPNWPLPALAALALAAALGLALAAGLVAWLRRRPVTRSSHGDPADHIARIDRLTEAGRVNWFGLMAYLVFAFITVLGVEDADFFIPSRQTDLPLVGVTIPTEAFFTFAPVLGVALYVYLHLYVRKATGALCAAPARINTATDPSEAGDPEVPLERKLKPWLLNDMVLRMRRDGAIEPRPLDWLASATVVLLVWLAGPFVLFAMWVRSWPAHNEVMTTLAGACLALSLYAGHVSWVRMTRDLAGRTSVFRLSDLPRFTLLAALSAGILWLGWIKTESGRPWDDPPEQTATMTGALTVFVRTLPNVLMPDWWVSLTPARLAEVQFAALPPDAADRTAARHRFRDAWCDRHGLTPAACGRAPRPGTAPFPNAAALRAPWCAERGIAEGQPCADHFATLEQEFAAEWTGHRTATLAALDKPDLRGADLRGADLFNASLTGVVLRNARLEGANLDGAEMEGADLYKAQMARADLSWAQMEGAVLRSARMEGAVLVGAQMDGADLSGAQMAGADLRGAQMAGADLRGAQMAFAKLRRAQMSGANLRGAQMERALLSEAQMDGAILVGAQMAGATLVGAQMAGAEFLGAQMVGAIFIGAQMAEAGLSAAQMEGADFQGTQFQSASWADASIGASVARSADFRGGSHLHQYGLSSLIGNAATLLPEALDDGSEPYICTCWAADPPGLDVLIARFARTGSSEAKLRERTWFCPGGTPMKTGTPWPLDWPRPDQPQAAGESDRSYFRRIDGWSRAVNTGACPPQPWWDDAAAE